MSVIDGFSSVQENVMQLILLCSSMYLYYSKNLFPLLNKFIYSFFTVNRADYIYFPLWKGLFGKLEFYMYSLINFILYNWDYNISLMLEFMIF